MSISINGSTGISGVDGDATTPALQGGDVNTGVYFPAADQVAISTNGSGRLFVDANGRIGVATTTPKEVIDARGAAVFSGDHATAANAYDTAHGIMLSSTSGLASVKAVSNGANDVAIRFIPLSAGSGSEAARITPDGKLGLGTSAPENLIHADFSQDGFTDGSNTSYSAASSLQLRNTNTDSANSGSLISFRTRGTSGPFSNWYVGARNEVAVPTTSDSKGSSFKISQLTASATGTVADRLVISASGNVGIGTTSPNTILEASTSVNTGGAIRITNPNSGTGANASFVAHNGTFDASFGIGGTNYTTYAAIRPNAAFIYCNQANGIGLTADNANGFINFVTGGSTERARIDSSGRLLVGTSTSQGSYNLQCFGTGVWGQGAYVNGSDASLKDNVQDLESALDVVKALRPVTFQYKSEYSQDTSTQSGFIAQELQQAMQGKQYLDGIVKPGTNHLNVAYQGIIAVLVKAVQELEAEVQALKGGN